MFFKSIVAAAASLATLSAAAPTAHRASGEVIPGSYIIRLKDNVKTDTHLSWANGIHARSAGKNDFSGILREFKGHSFHGYSGHFDKDTIAKIDASDEVAYVEPDRVWYLDDFIVSKPKAKREPTTQSPAPWGLAAITHREPGATEYPHDSAAGEGAFAYVVDSGIRVSHREFEGRASNGWTAYEGKVEDTSGHGTHVAGTIGGVTFGVAKKANLISVKVFEGRETATSIIIAGFDWAVSDIISNGRQNNAVINMSLGGPKTQAWNDAIDKAFSEGVLCVVAAGNYKVDAKDTSPASAPSSFTVGAVNENWEIVTNWDNGQGSNFGAVLDIFAPGDNIESASFKNDEGSLIMGGTSMACPHVAGMALYAMTVNGVQGAQAVTDHLLKNAGQDVVRGPIYDSPNRMANLGN